MKKKQIYLIIIIILLASNLFLGVKYFNVSKELKETKNTVIIQQEKTKFTEFNKTFISEVLQTKSEVNYDTRLKLDEMVKDIDDKDLTAQWQKFTDSQTEKEAQEETVRLLGLVAERME